MRILTLDVGNTTVDAVLFEEGKIRHIGRFEHRKVSSLKGNYDVVGVVSVRRSVSQKLREIFGEKLVELEFGDIPIEIDYRTPETLGTDRVLFAYGVREFYSKDAVLISVGTALVVDLMLDGVFMGGFITSGPALKLKALSERAEGVPELKLEKLNVPLGKSTRECVVGGVFLESLYFIERISLRWSEEFKREIPVYVTGGDGELFKDLGVYDPLILHRAIHRIIING